jgi:hypothetical protein
MATPRILMRTIIFAVVSLTIVLASIGRWIVSGCPVGFSCGSCQSASGGRAIVGSSYNLLTNISMTADKTEAVLDLDGRHIVVRERASGRRHGSEFHPARLQAARIHRLRHSPSRLSRRKNHPRN